MFVVPSAAKRRAVVTPRAPTDSAFRTPARQLVYDDASPISRNSISPGNDSITSTACKLFIYSPFGLSCAECPSKPQIKFEKAAIQQHLRKHRIDSKSSTVTYVHEFISLQLKDVSSIDGFRADRLKYAGFQCICGEVFPGRKDNAQRHCNRIGCDATKIEKIETVKLYCGRYVSQAQITALFKSNIPRLHKQFDYTDARLALEPFLLEKEKRDHTYTHLYLPLIVSCGGGRYFSEKIQLDHSMIHSAPNSDSEEFLETIHEMAEKWLKKYAQSNVLLVPGNLRAALQTFEGVEVNEISQKTTYTMQHNPSSIWPELKKLLSLAFRSGLFCKENFDVSSDFAIADFLTGLLLEPAKQSVTTVPFAAEYCLMSAFRLVGSTGEIITMVSCDTVSSVFSKISSVLKAAACSVICSYTEDAFTVHGLRLVNEIRKSPVLHILSPMIRQLREMHSRIPKRRKTTLDTEGNITIDQFRFPFDDWSTIVPRTVALMRFHLQKLSDGVWWEQYVDIYTKIKVSVDETNGELSIDGCNPIWKESINGEDVDTLSALLEMAFHGFGGGSARRTELVRPSMFNAVFSNETVYYTSDSIKVYNHASRRSKHIERKLPPIVGRYFLLFRVLICSNKQLYAEGEHSLLLPVRRKHSGMSVRHVIRDFFGLSSLPDMTQIRQFWAGVSNHVYGGPGGQGLVTASDLGAEKMGHSSATHASQYSSQMVGAEESHFKRYHFAIGDTSHDTIHHQPKVTVADLRAAMKLRHPETSGFNGSYLSVQQKELIEWGYGPQAPHGNCLGLLAPGQGKSDCYLIPTIARSLGKKMRHMIIYVCPYSFLAAYQFANARLVVEKLGLSDINMNFFTGCDIHEGNLPDDLSCIDSLPALLFLNLDALSNLFQYYLEELKSWTNLIDKIVLDEVHTVLSEISFRPNYKVYEKLSLLGVPIVALSGSVPQFAISKLAIRLSLTSSSKTNQNMTVICGGDLVGMFPKGFKIHVEIHAAYLPRVANYVSHLLRGGSMKECAVHIFVAAKSDGERLIKVLQHRFDCRFANSDCSPEEIARISADWGQSRFRVLVSTTIALVGNENPQCRHLACAGYLYDSMQVVQAFGRLRTNMRKSFGEVFFYVPKGISTKRLQSDNDRFARLWNDGWLHVNDKEQFFKTMASEGVMEWSSERRKNRENLIPPNHT